MSWSWQTQWSSDLSVQGDLVHDPHAGSIVHADGLCKIHVNAGVNADWFTAIHNAPLVYKVLPDLGAKTIRFEAVLSSLAVDAANAGGTGICILQDPSNMWGLDLIRYQGPDRWTVGHFSVLGGVGNNAYAWTNIAGPPTPAAPLRLRIDYYPALGVTQFWYKVGAGAWTMLEQNANLAFPILSFGLYDKGWTALPAIHSEWDEMGVATLEMVADGVRAAPLFGYGSGNEGKQLPVYGKEISKAVTSIDIVPVSPRPGDVAGRRDHATFDMLGAGVLAADTIQVSVLRDGAAETVYTKGKGFTGGWSASQIEAADGIGLRFTLVSDAGWSHATTNTITVAAEAGGISAERSWSFTIRPWRYSVFRYLFTGLRSGD